MQTQVTHLDWFSSDHRPICLYLATEDLVVQPFRQRRAFKFEEMWISNERCKNIVEGCWSVSEGPVGQHVGVGLDFQQTVQKCGRQLLK